MKNTVKDTSGVMWRWLSVLTTCIGMLPVTGQNEEDTMRFGRGHKYMYMCVECQTARFNDQQKMLEEQKKNQPPPKGTYIRKGVLATYEPTGVRARNDAALRQLGVVSWSYYVKDTAFSPRVIAEFKFADGRQFKYSKKCKAPKEPVDIVQEWLMENGGTHGVAANGITPSRYRNKQAFIEDYVSYRLRTASDSERMKYRGSIEGWEKSFRRVLVQEADRIWRNNR